MKCILHVIRDLQICNNFYNIEVMQPCTDISKFIVPILRDYAAITDLHPQDMTLEEWRAIVRCMANAFDMFANNVETRNNSDYRNREQGLNLFAQYFNHLWYE